MNRSELDALLVENERLHWRLAATEREAVALAAANSDLRSDLLALRQGRAA